MKEKRNMTKMKYSNYQVFYTLKDQHFEDYKGSFKIIKAISPIEAMNIFKKNHPDCEIVAVV